jgi:hypothetical protein
MRFYEFEAKGCSPARDSAAEAVGSRKARTETKQIASELWWAGRVEVAGVTGGRMNGALVRPRTRPRKPKTPRAPSSRSEINGHAARVLVEERRPRW